MNWQFCMSQNPNVCLKFPHSKTQKSDDSCRLITAETIILHVCNVYISCLKANVNGNSLFGCSFEVMDDFGILKSDFSMFSVHVLYIYMMMMMMMYILIMFP